MNKILMKIQNKAIKNDEVRPFISTDDILLIRSEFDTEDELLLVDISSWLKEQNIANKNFNSLDDYLKKEVSLIDATSHEEIFDKITPVCLNIVNNLSAVEQQLIHYLSSGIITTDNLSNILTIKMLQKKIKMSGSAISVFLSRLSKKGIVKRRLIHQRNFNYSINSEIFIDWYNFRYKPKPIKA